MNDIPYGPFLGWVEAQRATELLVGYCYGDEYAASYDTVASLARKYPKVSRVILEKAIAASVPRTPDLVAMLLEL